LTNYITRHIIIISLVSRPAHTTAEGTIPRRDAGGSCENKAHRVSGEAGHFAGVGSERGFTMDVREVFGEGWRHKVTVYVPSTRDIDVSLSEDAAEFLVRAALREFSEIFGGATAVKSTGAWLSDVTGQLVLETPTLVWSYTPELTRENLEAVRRFCERVKVLYGQQEIAVEIDGVFLRV
jgi:hypothetical protein